MAYALMRPLRLDLESFAGMTLVCDLLDRIAVLEAAIRCRGGR
jgi:hypothetical protein